MTKISNDYSKIPNNYVEDVARIVNACFRRGIIITPEEAYHGWSDYSDSRAAGWLVLPRPYDDGESPWVCTEGDCDREIVEIMERYVGYK